MRGYEFTLVGFDGGTDETDHLVKWVAAAGVDEAMDYARLMQWDILTVTELPFIPHQPD